jgi:hypothetical protein
MAAAVVVAIKIGSKRYPKRFFIDRVDLVEALSPNEPNQPLDMERLPGVSCCGKLRLTKSGCCA